MPALYIRINGVFDGTTLMNSADAKVAKLTGTSSAFSVSTLADGPLPTVGVFPLGVLDTLAAKGGGSGLLSGSTCRVVYGQYQGAATELSLGIAVIASGLPQLVSPLRTIDPSSANPAAVFDLAMPSLDHALIVLSNAASGAQVLTLFLQEVDPKAPIVDAFTADASTFVAPMPFASNVAVAAQAIAVNTIQPYDASGGAFAMTTPGIDLPNARFAVKETASNATALTITATGGADIEDPAGGVGASAVVASADATVQWQLDPNGTPTWRIVT